MSEPTPSIESVLARLTTEFIDTCRERMDDVEAKVSTLAAHKNDPSDDLSAVKRTIHSIKGQAGTFGFPTIGRIAEALEAYIDAIGRPKAGNLDAIRDHLDAIRKIVERRENPSPEEEARIVRDLPPVTANHPGGD
jgi:two-component system, chemotaxis family, sensor kinase CheA